MKLEVLEKIIERLAAILGKETGSFNEDTLFADLNLKSVNYSQLTTTLEDAFDVEVPYMEFKRKKTLGEAAEYIVSLADE